MLQKNIDKKKRAERPNQWKGFAPKSTKTKVEKVRSLEKKHKNSSVYY